MLKKILWKGQKYRQIVGAAIGAFIGAFLVLLAQQFYFDFTYLVHHPTERENEYLSLHKKVVAYDAHFSDEELQNLLSHPKIDTLAAFTASQFEIKASSPNFGVMTDLFFESIANEFIDFDLNESSFRWTTGQAEIPIIISRDYVALYNFGFAPGQGLPQLSPAFIERLRLQLDFSGNGLKRTFKGKIVGYSDRIHSILVPIEFMDWANTNFGEYELPGPSRVMVALHEQDMVELRGELEQKGYEISSGELVGKRIRNLLSKVLTATVFIGVLMVVLSLLVFILNFQLLISNAENNIHLLFQIGYKSKQIASVLIVEMLKIFIPVVLLSFLGLCAFRYFSSKVYLRQGIDYSSNIHSSIYISVFLLIVLGVSIISWSIQKKLKALY